MKLTLGTDSQARKDTPMLAGLKGYFLAALAGVARHSFRSNAKHNPGEPMHWARGKSMDHGETVERHLSDCEEMRAWLEALPTGEYGAHVKAYLEECDALAWRALAYSQIAYEKYGGAPLSFNSRVTPPAMPRVPVLEQPPAPDNRGCPDGFYRAPWPPVCVNRSTSDTVWQADGSDWYFNPPKNMPERGAALKEYPTEAAARAAYWVYVNSNQRPC